MQKNLLHITNGDSTAVLIEASAIEGDVLPWRDPMHHGPFPAVHNLDELGVIRAEYLAGQFHDINDIKRDFRLRNKQLRSASLFAEVILWFEHDLLDQLQILELLHWFSQPDIKSSHLSIICINQFPGITQFRGLGQLNSEQIESLLPLKTAVTGAQLVLANTAWKAFCSEDPRQIQNLINRELSTLPFLKTALRRHLQEYPWIDDGLTRSERQILTLCSSGVESPKSLFLENMALEKALYLGDWHTYRIIARLNNNSPRLLSCTPEDTFLYPPEHQIASKQFERQRLFLASAGKDVLSGYKNARSFFNRNEWLGGVHLDSHKPMWMLDDSSLQMVLH